MGIKATTADDWSYAYCIYLLIGDTTTQLIPLTKLINPNNKHTMIRYEFYLNYGRRDCSDEVVWLINGWFGKCYYWRVVLI